MNRIKELRKAYKLSQKEFASILKVHQTAVSQWEKERTAPDIEILKKMAHYFNVSVDFILGLESWNDWSKSYSEKIREQMYPTGSLFDSRPIKMTDEDAKMMKAFYKSRNSNDPVLKALLAAIDKRIGEIGQKDEKEKAESKNE